MNERKSAGLLMYSLKNGDIKFFLVHPGGPFFANKDEGYWSIPKGIPEDNEQLLDTAKREFKEETGLDYGDDFIPLGTVNQKNNKTVHAWAFRTEIDNPVEITCNTCQVEWPPNSGRKITIPEVDKGNFFSEDEAKKKINSAQAEFIDRLLDEIKKQN